MDIIEQTLKETFIMENVQNEMKQKKKKKQKLESKKRKDFRNKIFNEGTSGVWEGDDEEEMDDIDEMGSGCEDDMDVDDEYSEGKKRRKKRRKNEMDMDDMDDVDMGEDDDDFGDDDDIDMEDDDDFGGDDDIDMEDDDDLGGDDDFDEYGEDDEFDDEDDVSTLDEDEAMDKLCEMSREDVRASLGAFSKKLGSLVQMAKDGYKATDELRKISSSNEFLKAGEAITALELIKRGVDPKKARGKNALAKVMKRISGSAGKAKIPMEDTVRALMDLQSAMPL